MGNLKVWKDSHSMLRNPQSNTWSVECGVLSIRHKFGARGPFLKSSYERFFLYEFVERVLNYRSNEFVALTNLCDTGPCYLRI